MATDKARRLVDQLLKDNPTYTGKLVLNFHSGDLSDNAAVEHSLKLKDIGASRN
jgi:hypothetical protein